MSAYASTTHWISEKLAFSCLAMLGNATLTIVMSSSSMNVAVQTTTSVHHLRSIGRRCYLLARRYARPYTGSAAPLVGLESSESRCAMTAAISAGLTHRSKSASGIEPRLAGTSPVAIRLQIGAGTRP